MKNSFQLTGLALIISTVALSGCAAQKAWSPELEQARAAYSQAASNPLVASLASAELQQAQQQLTVAENASDFFKSRPEIAHEATLAQLMSLEAEQTARALQAKGNLKLAQSGAPIPQVLPETLPETLQDYTIYSTEPTMAAAIPAYEESTDEITTTELHSTGIHSGEWQSAEYLSESNTELQQLSTEVAALRRQLNALQSKNNDQSTHQLEYLTDYTVGHVANEPIHNVVNYEEQPNTHRVGKTVSLDDGEDLDLFEELNMAPELSLASSTEASIATALELTPESAEPAMGAARPAAVDDKSIQPGYSDESVSPSINMADVESDASLRAHLRAMNARPSSDGGMALTLGERYFEKDTARLWNGRAARHLDNIAAVLVDNSGLVIDVEAHTDNNGTEEQRNKLTADRAIAIKAALVMRGVDGSRVNTTGFGSSAPLVDNDNPLAKAQNRRVEIIFPNVIE